MSKKTAILLVNLGSPDSPKPRDVYRYLTEFLNDPRVIDVPWLARALLVNGIIVPFRHRKSAKVYKELWTENGSPLIHYGNRVRELLQERFRDGERVFLAMRYQNPSMDKVLQEIHDWGADQILLVPLFPQYASATNGSVMAKAFAIMKKWWVIPNVKMIAQFYDLPEYIRGFVENGKAFNLDEYDHVLFSYHGLPERQVDKVYEDRACRNHSCEHEINDENKFCYKATCYATTRAIASGLGLRESDYTVCFQSRLGRGWIEPFSDKIIEELAKKGARKLLVFSPAFVADCLETIIEIGEEYQELFEKHGGEKVQLVPSLNDSATWIDGLERLVRTNL
ncbi:MAG: ferrochelatase [Flavobacteriales bacterium]|jgi:ferrochelatase